MDRLTVKGIVDTVLSQLGDIIRPGVIRHIEGTAYDPVAGLNVETFSDHGCVVVWDSAGSWTSAKPEEVPILVAAMAGKVCMILQCPILPKIGDLLSVDGEDYRVHAITDESAGSGASFRALVQK